MEWQALKSGFTMAVVGSGESIERTMAEFCQQIKDHVIPKNDGIAWNCLRVEFWPDSGRLIAFPSLTSMPRRIERAGCQIVFADLLAQYEELAESELDDDAIVVALLEAEQGWITMFLDAARQIGLTGYRFQFWNGEAEFPIWDAQL